MPLVAVCPVLAVLFVGSGCRPPTTEPEPLQGIVSTSILPQLAHRRISAELPAVAALLPGPEALAAALFAIVMDGATD